MRIPLCKNGTMKKLILLFNLCLFAISAYNQVTTPAIKARFGADGELRSNFFNGFLVSGNDDWFSNNVGGTGSYMIDTSGATYIRNRYATDPAFRMTPFFRGMNYPQFSIVNGSMLIDGIFIRDHHGDDSTVFSGGGNKNGMSPASWSCPVSQGIPDKNDILDFFMHVRRDGVNNADSLWLFGGVSIENTTGSRYFDFEMYQTDIYFDRSTLSFKGYGPDEGHTSWEFDASGNVLKTGDIIFTAEFNNSGISVLEARIWINKNSMLLTPTAFDWGGQFDGAIMSSEYGYANISPKNPGDFYTGLQCGNNTWAGPFGLIRQDNSYVINYNAKQFMEFSVNLSKLGLDPLVNGNDPCTMPFRRILVKSRASASFSASLKDFVGPFSFFRAPMVEASADIPFYCGIQGVSTISVNNPLSTSLYTWSTVDGNIISDPFAPDIVVNHSGTYIVQQQLMDSCGITYASDTVIITYDPMCSVLASKLLYFNGSTKGEGVDLNWSITGSDNLKFMTLERSDDDGKVFYELANIKFAPNAAETRHQFTDKAAFANSSQRKLYRLKMTDKNGRNNYSKVLVFLKNQSNQEGTIKLINNAGNPAQLLVNAISTAPLQLELFDMSGRRIAGTMIQVSQGSSIVPIKALEQQKAGIYILKVKLGQQDFIQKVVR